MKSTLHILYTIIVLLSGCNRSETIKEKMVYDESITKIWEGDYSYPASLLANNQNLPAEWNLHSMEKAKSKVGRLDFLSNARSDNYVYGQARFFKDTLIIYSSEYEPFGGDNVLKYGHVIGYAVLINNGKIKKWIKVFDSVAFTGEILISYLYDKYIISIYSVNEAFDVIIEGEKPHIDYSFVVTEITEFGEMRFLDEKAGRRIAKKHLSSNELYEGRF